LAAEYGENEPDSAISIYSRAIHLAELLDFRPGIAQAYADRGWVYRQIGATDTAASDFDRSLEEFERLDDRSGQALVYKMKGQLLRGEPEAIRFYKRSRELYMRLGDSLGVSQSYNEEGITLSELGDQETSEEYYIRALRWLPVWGSAALRAALTNNLAYKRYKRGEYLDALAGFKKSVQMRRSPSPFVLTNVGKAFEGLGQLDSALVWGRRGFEVAQDGGLPRSIRYNAEFLKDVLVATGQD